MHSSEKSTVHQNILESRGRELACLFAKQRKSLLFILTDDLIHGFFNQKVCSVCAFSQIPPPFFVF